MTKKEMLQTAKVELEMVAFYRAKGWIDFAEASHATAKRLIKEVNRRIYQEKLQRQVMKFPVHVMYESIMVSPIPSRFMFEYRNINWSH